ncbi:AIR synthase related protein [Gallaecimonas xiamenensis]|uniref:AIR synthase related protein n=1 Tax=Gallaecimonas xiamenensis TaxID=1207039 RepID=UPI0012E9E6ED|nr:AIR synthase related protein [Gallaecimonas xiamenensis]
MLDYDQTYFGCGNKVPAHSLKSLLDENDYSFLIPDNNIVKINDEFLVSSIDTVFPFTSDIALFTKATVLHCANDLFASGVYPIQANVSVGVSASLNVNEIKQLFNSLKVALNEREINSCNYHTFRADQTSVTIAMNGTAKELKSKARLSGEYDIFLTKPIGFWTTQKHRAGDANLCSKQLLLESNSTWLYFIQSELVKYSTDISGFGLIGHIASFLKSQQYCASLDLDRIISPLNIDFANIEHYLGCSAKSNLESFGACVSSVERLNDVVLDVLFGGEINGPILMIVEQGAELGMWFDKLMHIGTASPHVSTENQIIKVRG